MALEFFVLGPLEVRRCGREVPVRSGRQRVLLAALLLRANRVVPLEELIDRVWGESPPRGARNTLSAYVMRLRRALGAPDGGDADDADYDGGAAAPGGGAGGDPADGTGHGVVITTHPEGYRIEVEPDRLDLLRFEALLAEASATADPAVEFRLLRRADELWRGPAMSNVDSDVLHRDAVSALVEQRLRAVQRRIDLDLQLGADAELVPELKALTAEHPTRERFTAQLMIALYRSGRQADALDTYRGVRELLDAELGVEPGEDLRELHQSVLTADPVLAPARTPRSTLGEAGSEHALAVFEPPGEPDREPPQPPEPPDRTDPVRHEAHEPDRPGTAWPASREPSPRWMSRWRALAPLGAIWSLAAVLTIFAGSFDSYLAYWLGVLLMGIVLVITIAAVVSVHRLRGAEPANPRWWRARAVRVATALPLLVCGYVLTHVVGDVLDVAAMWWVPVFASAVFANVVLLGLLGAVPARAPGPAMSGAVLSATGAVACGGLIGALIVFAQRGMEHEWATGHGLSGAFAEGSVGRAAGGDITVSGRVVDGEADYLGARMYLTARFPDGQETWDIYNKDGKGSAEQITDFRDPGADDLIVRGDAESISVRVCSSRADVVRKQVLDFDCGTPREIWPR